MEDNKVSGNLIVEFKDVVPPELEGRLTIGINKDKLIINVRMDNEDEMKMRKIYFEYLMTWIKKLRSTNLYLSENNFYQLKFPKEFSEDTFES